MHPEAEWRAHLSEGRFMLQRSRSTGGFIFYPRIVEPKTGADDLEWVEASGAATVHAVTVVRKKDPADNYNVVIIELAEGPRLMSRVDGVPPDSVTIDMAVRASIVEEDDREIVVFVPA